MRNVQASNADWIVGRDTNSRRWYIQWRGQGNCPILDGVPFTQNGFALIRMRRAVDLTITLALRVQETTIDGNIFRNALATRRATLAHGLPVDTDTPGRVYAWLFEGDVHTGSLARWAADDQHARPRSMSVSKPVEIIAGKDRPALREVITVVEGGEWITDTVDTAPCRVDVHA